MVKTQRASKKRTPVKASAQGAVEEFVSTMMELKEELESAKDALEEKFSGTDRYNALETAIDEIDGIDELESLDWEEPFSEIDVEYVTNQRSGISRAVRRDNATAAASAAMDALENWISDNEDHDKVDDVRQIIDSIEEYHSKAESIEFPGWRG